jgi:hypothetical protein
MSIYLIIKKNQKIKNTQNIINKEYLEISFIKKYKINKLYTHSIINNKNNSFSFTLNNFRIIIFQRTFPTITISI